MNKLFLIALFFLAVSKLASSRPHPHNEDYQQHYHNNYEVILNADEGNDDFFGQWTIEGADGDYFTEDVNYEIPDDEYNLPPPAVFVRDQNGVFRTIGEDGVINYDEAFSYDEMVGGAEVVHVTGHDDVINQDDAVSDSD